MITSISEDVGRSYRRNQVTPLEAAYSKLHQFIDKIDQKIVNRLQLVQQTYMDDYKQQVKAMSQQLQILRTNLDAEVLYQKSNEKMYFLEEERDFFRTQVMKLNGEVNILMDENKILKKKITDLTVDIENYKTIAFNYEKKVQKFQYERNQMASFKRDSSAPTLPRTTIIKQETEYRSKASQSQIEHEQQIEQAHRTVTVNSAVNYTNRGRQVQTIRTKTYSKGESLTKASLKKYEEMTAREQIIDDCIRQVKREIFYRANEAKNSNNIPFDEFTKIPFEKFTKTDKKNLIYKLLTNEKIVEDFNEFLLTRNSYQAASRMVRTKVGDERYNDKFLSDLKKSFSKKIFDLKTNQEPLRQTTQKRRY